MSAAPLDPRLVRYLLRMQFAINVLSSVAIEYPRLRTHPLLNLDTAPVAVAEGTTK